MARGGDVFVLDMGESVRIHDLARRMVELTGRRVRDAQTPWGDIEIKITGLRPGEKLYEELLIDERAEPTGHPRILKSHEDFLPWAELEPALNRLAEQMHACEHAALRDTLTQLVAGYRPPNSVMDWVFQAKRQAPAAEPDASVAPAAENVIALPTGGPRRSAV